jgi:hypothetical protein
MIPDVNSSVLRHVGIPRIFGSAACAFVTVTALFGAEPASAPPPTPVPTPELPARSTVVAVRDEHAVNSLRPDAARVHAMVNRAVMAVTGHTDIVSAWRSLVNPSDVVGIKIAAAGGPLGSTRKPVVAAIVDGLVAAGVPRSQIIVWDRDEDELRAAGYLAPGAGGGAVVRPIRPRSYDRSVAFTAAVLGRLIWGDLDFIGNSPLAATLPSAPLPPGDPFRAGGRPPANDDGTMSDRSYFATILTKDVTKIVNVPTMTDSAFAGLAGCLYNMTLPNIDNWRRFTLVKQFGMVEPRTSADPYVAEIFSDPLIAPRVVLNVMDGLVAQFAGGPEFHPQYCRPHATIYASRDPVALDTVALRTIEQWREQANMPPAGEGAKYLWSAEQIKLGHASLDKIDIRRLTP